MMWTRVLAGVLLACGVLPATTRALDKPEQEDFRPLVQKVVVNGRLFYQAGVMSGKTIEVDPLLPVEVEITFVNQGETTAARDWLLFIQCMDDRDKNKIAAGGGGALDLPTSKWFKDTPVIVTKQVVVSQLPGKTTDVFVGLYDGAPRCVLLNREFDSQHRLPVGALKIRGMAAGANRPASPPRNLLGEGSDFEVGPHGLNAFCDYDLRGVFDRPGVQPVFDETICHQGRFSLRLTAADPHLEKREARFGRGWVKDKINYVNAVEFAPVKLDPATTYTLSAWLRSDTDGMVAFMSCWEPSDYYSNGAFCRTMLLPVSKEWKRYSYTFKADTFKVLNYRQARIGISSDVVKGALWIDEVQLEQGVTASAYLAAPLEFGVAIGQPCKLFPVEELGNASITARFRNNSATVATVKVNYKITDYWDTPVANGDIQATLAANGNAAIPVKLPALPCGYYRAFFASADGRQRDEAILGVYQPVANGATTSWLGCHYSPTVAGGATPLHRQLGFGWVRLFTRFSFNQVCPAEGKFDFSETDVIVERCKKAQLNVMPILGDGFYYTNNQMLNPIPDWAVERKVKSSVKDSWAKEGVVFPRLAAWKAYVKAVVSRYKGDIKAWEIMNEPNCWVTAEEYAPYLKAAYDAAKEADPDCLIVGGGATSDWGGSPAAWTTRLLAIDKCQHLNALSIHLYGNTPPERIETLGTDKILAEIKRECAKYGKDMPIWHTEKSHSTTKPGYSQVKFNLPAAYQLQPGFSAPDFRAKAEYLIRETLIDSSVGKGPFFWFAELPNDIYPAAHCEPYELHHVEYEGSPCPEILAANGLARMLEGRNTPRELVKLTASDYCALYDGPRGTLAALWNGDSRSTLILPPDIGTFTLCNFFGTAMPAPPAGTLVLGTAPVYLLFNGRASDAVKALLVKSGTASSKPAFSGGLELEGDSLVLAVYTVNSRYGDYSAELKLRDLPPGWSFKRTSAHLQCPFEACVRSSFSVATLQNSARTLTFPFKAGADGGALAVPPLKSAGILRAVLSDSTAATAFAVMSGDIVIDGNLSEWNDAGYCGAATAGKVKFGRGNWKDPLDLSCEMRFRWDATALYVGAMVYDDVMERNAPADRACDSDGLELFLGLDTSSSGFVYGDYDFQIFLAPGTETPGKLKDATAWCAQLKNDAGITVASKRVTYGYVIEAAIPWKSLKKDFVPRKDEEILMSFMVKDADVKGGQSQKALFWAGDDCNWKTPRNWGTLEFKIRQK